MSWAKNRKPDQRRQLMSAFGRVIDALPTPVLDAVASTLPRRRRPTVKEVMRYFPVTESQAPAYVEMIQQNESARAAHRLAAALLLDALLTQTAGSGVATDDAAVLVGMLMDEFDVTEMRPVPLTPEQRMRRQWDRLRTKLTPVVMKRDGAFCRTCGTTDSLTIDHRTPLAKGGTNDLDNLQVLCGSCNSSKGDRLSEPVEAVIA